jgi:uncharacterized protein
MKTFEYPPAYIDFLAEYYGSRDYFECHELMEEHWKEHPDSHYSTCWLVFIRIAVCLYHARRGNWKGAAKLMAKGAEEAADHAALFCDLGIDGYALAERLSEAARQWTSADALAYADIELPIVDEYLLDAARRRCEELGYAFGKHGLAAGEDIIHRHLTRDRSDVVAARAESAKQKALDRSRAQGS